MPARSIPLVKVRRLATLHATESFPSISRLSKILSISRTTIRDYRRRIQESGYSFADFSALSPKETRVIFRQQVIRKPRPERYTTLLSILPEVGSLMSKGEANLRESWTEYRNRYPHGYGYSQFTEHFRAWRQLHGFRTTPSSKWRVTHILEQDVSELKKWRRSNNRTKWAKAVAILDLNQGTRITILCSKLEKSLRVIKRWRKAYIENGLDGLCSPQHRRQSQEKLEEMKKKRDRMVEILHESPQLHGINRASWSLKTLSRAYEGQYGEPIGMSTISEYISAQGYAFKKARRVLTSPDPEYREKLKEITKILSSLHEDEKFFSIDEFGPFSVKMQGGRAFTPHDLTRVVPQRQRSKGRLILTGALELSTNQITHFYSEKKNTDEMIKLLDILLEQYSNQRCLYLSWDAASWHMSAKLSERVSELNSAAAAAHERLPVVKLAPLPASAQFLNVIESVFSGMAKAVIHNSDYQSVEECKKAIDTYFAERNEYYRRNPRRAGNKIWGKELVLPSFKPSNNCKDPNWR
jgi:transposase